jgi:hypothetical protein
LGCPGINNPSMYRKPLSLQTVAFGDAHGSPVLRHMAQIALGIQNGVPVDPNAPGNNRVDSCFSEALDSVSYFFPHQSRQINIACRYDSLRHS